MSKVIALKNTREAPKAVRSTTDTLIFNVEEVESWKIPPFQRPRRINDKVKTIADELKQNGGFISGILTLGRLANDKTNWLVDGQHRIEAFKISGLKEGLADVRIMHFDTMAEMANEFVRLNSQIVKMRPDDVLRGLEATCRVLQIISHRCDFVGYDQIRRNTTGGPVVSMASILRCWNGSQPETPALSHGGSATSIATTMSELEAENCCVFLLTAHAAWGRDIENYRLWGPLNLCLCMWLYRRVVLDRDRTGVKRSTVLNIAQFKQCLMSLSASADYIDWLVGRTLNERDRRPAYDRIKDIFARRIIAESTDKKRPKLPSPAWTVS